MPAPVVDESPATKVFESTLGRLLPAVSSSKPKDVNIFNWDEYANTSRAPNDPGKLIAALLEQDYLAFGEIEISTRMADIRIAQAITDIEAKFKGSIKLFTVSGEPKTGDAIKEAFKEGFCYIQLMSDESQITELIYEYGIKPEHIIKPDKKQLSLANVRRLQTRGYRDLNKVTGSFEAIHNGYYVDYPVLFEIHRDDRGHSLRMCFPLSNRKDAEFLQNAVQEKIAKTLKYLTSREIDIGCTLPCDAIEVEIQDVSNGENTDHDVLVKLAESGTADRAKLTNAVLLGLTHRAQTLRLYKKPKGEERPVPFFPVSSE